MPASLSLFQIGSFGSSFDCPSFSASLNSLFNLHKETLSLIEQQIIQQKELTISLQFRRLSDTKRHVPNSYTAAPFPTTNGMNNNELSAVPALQGIWPQQQVVFVPVMPMPLPVPMPASAMTINTFNTNPIRYTAPAAPSADASCRCPKSRCLKLYCDCFRSQSVCSSTCACVDCLNTEGDQKPSLKH